MSETEVVESKADWLENHVGSIVGLWGLIANEVRLCVLDRVENGQPVLTGDGIPVSEDEFRPNLEASWCITPVCEELRDLESGVYVITGSDREGFEVKKSTGSMFETVFQMDTVFEIPPGESATAVISSES